MLRPFLKPYWKGESILFDSRNQRSLLFRIFLNSLPRTLDRAMGRYEAGRVGSELGYKNGSMITVFQESG